LWNLNPGYVRFSNRPVWVKHFQAIHRSGVDVARGLALLFGLGTKALVWGFLSQAG
jgi:hypothetical protein